MAARRVDGGSRCVPAKSLSPVEAFVQLRPFAGCGYHSTVQGTTVLLVYELRLPSGISLLTKPLRQLPQLQTTALIIALLRVVQLLRYDS